MTASTPQAVWLGGASASGKSAIAIVLAERVHGEIVSVDSMQVYRGLDVGTAKPSQADQRRVVHHLIDVVDLASPFSVGDFVNQVNAALEGIHQRGRLPILCGGTGLYFRALLDGLGSAPAPDPALRTQLEALPQTELLEELRRLDPVAFASIDRQNPRRVIRAVEVVRLTGRPRSQSKADWAAPSAPLPTFFALERSPEDLRCRIKCRVDAMFQGGLVDETRKLLRLGLQQNRTALQAIGYRQVVEHLEGQRTLPETVALVEQRTWQFVRRQQNWFRRHLPATPVPVAPDESPLTTVKRLQPQIGPLA